MTSEAPVTVVTYGQEDVVTSQPCQNNDAKNSSAKQQESGGQGDVVTTQPCQKIDANNSASKEPPGLKLLKPVTHLLVKQNVEILEALTSCETSNSYEIFTPTGQMLFKAREVPSGTLLRSVPVHALYNITPPLSFSTMSAATSCTNT
ncbi:phospholipid scramblase [Plakobranchus ocellatus]|uniref:Phospholipid scramblase n=1 Tax=Plakobranchus ocellatus TaxID=259542 RepID=A0AAV4CP59_9GAST|nr:phospholipid scramblase [Plakobranchus ocellatus]